MSEMFRESSHLTDIAPPKCEASEKHVPGTDELKAKMEDIFAQTMPDRQWPPEVSHEKPSTEAFPHTTTLEDGTVITFPLPEYNKTFDKTPTTGTKILSELPHTENKPTRELTDEEKDNLKEELGWTDKQIGKCTIDEDGVVHYRTDREDMEGKTGENGVTYQRKTVDIHGIKVQGVFPVFESTCDIQLPPELERASNAQQFRECNSQLKERVATDPELRASFTQDQLNDIEDGDTPSGYVWHHNEETGKMQLVKVEDHDRTQGGAAHTGGKALWGGGYSSHESSTDTKRDT